MATGWQPTDPSFFASNSAKSDSQDASSPAAPLPLNDITLKNFQVSRTFAENTALINSIDFSPTGDKLISSANDDTIVIYDCHKGSVHKIINSKKYGAENIIFTHSPLAVLHSGNKFDHNIRYLDVNENKYNSVFNGHKDKIFQIVLSPIDDTFMSSSQDGTVRIWDHNQGCVGVVPNLGLTPAVCFDPEGLIFAVNTCEEREERILLYDARNYGDGPFNVFRYPEEDGGAWRMLKMSNDGKYLLVCTNGFKVYVMDAFDGRCLFVFKGHTNRGYVLEASFTPDSNYVLVSSFDGRIFVWSLKTGEQVAVLTRHHPDSAICLKFSPNEMVFASAGSRLSFWLPKLPS